MDKLGDEADDKTQHDSPDDAHVFTSLRLDVECIIQEKGVAAQGVSTVVYDRWTSVFLLGTLSTCRAFTRKTLALLSEIGILISYNDLSYIGPNWSFRHGHRGPIN